MDRCAGPSYIRGLWAYMRAILYEQAIAFIPTDVMTLPDKTIERSRCYRLNRRAAFQKGLVAFGVFPQVHCQSHSLKKHGFILIKGISIMKNALS